MPDNSTKRLVEIDGLRAVALVGVLLYHARISSFFTGGFVGVDIFFVISGYVVTLSLLRTISKGKLSYSYFLRRRILRLIPALLATILATNIFVFVLFTEKHRKEAAKLGLSSIFSLSNVVLWLQSNYFDTDSQLKPYLHTWSLSVEWQFYLSWAFITSFLVRKIRSNTKQIVSVMNIAILSLLLATLTIFKYPTAAFYNSIFRYFEFMCGAIPAWFTSQSKALGLTEENEETHSKFQKFGFQFLSFTSFSIICLYMLVFNTSYVFPGLSVLPLCISTSVLICHSKYSLVGQMLRHPVMQWLGEISYSVYLVHWPVLVLLDYYLLSKSSIILRVISLGFSFFLGHYLNKVIEQPFYKAHGKVRMGERMKSVLIVAMGMLVAMQIFLMFSQSKSFHKEYQRQSWSSQLLARSMKLKEARKRENRGHVGLICHMSSTYKSTKNFEECNPRSKSEIVLVGDSHAQDFYKALNESLPPYATATQLTAAGFSFTGELGEGAYKYRATMYNSISKLLEPRKKNIRAAVLVSRWENKIQAEDLQRLNDTIRYFQDKISVPVFVFGPRPEFAVAPLRILETKTNKESTKEKIEGLFLESLRVKEQVDENLRGVVEANNATYVSILKELCEYKIDNKGERHIECNIFSENDQVILYTDRHHINSVGAAKLLSSISTELKKAL